MSRVAAVHPVLPDHRYPQREITELFAEVCLGPEGKHQLRQAPGSPRRLHSSAQTELLLVQWRRLLAPNGRLVLGDLIPPDVGALTDASALLRFAGANGFLFAAGTGLVKTFFSDYRQKRAELGLLRFSEPEIRAWCDPADSTRRGITPIWVTIPPA